MTEKNVYSSPDVHSEPVLFGGVLRVAEVYFFIMLIRGSLATISGSCVAIFGNAGAAANSVAGNPVLFYVSYAFSWTAFLAAAFAILRLLRVATGASRNRIRALLVLMSLIFAILGVVALNIPEPTSGILQDWTESRSFIVGAGLFVDAAAALMVSLIFSLSARAKMYYSR